MYICIYICVWCRRWRSLCFPSSKHECRGFLSPDSTGKDGRMARVGSLQSSVNLVSHQGKLLDRFRDAKSPLRILVVCGRLLEGFDCPQVSVIGILVSEGSCLAFFRALTIKKANHTTICRAPWGQFVCMRERGRECVSVFVCVCRST
jgi:hypothetical protein